MTQARRWSTVVENWAPGALHQEISMLYIVGIILIALGLLSGSVLVAAAVGLVAAEPGLTLWLTFPGLSIFGFVLLAMQAEPAQVRTVSVASSALLLVLAMASVIVLVLSAASLLQAPSGTAALWYVLVVGVVLGSFGAASYGRPGDGPKVSGT
jgi:hypothetical protein